MKFAYGEIWDMDGDILCITTNGFIKKNGSGVMGAGIAGQAQDRYPKLPVLLGEKLKKLGNHVQPLVMHTTPKGTNQGLVMFPVKHVWYENADIELIKRSAKELIAEADEYNWQRVLLPCPGCGNGKLSWDEVIPVLAKMLDDRFILVRPYHDQFKDGANAPSEGSSILSN